MFETVHWYYILSRCRFRCKKNVSTLFWNFRNDDIVTWLFERPITDAI